MNAGRVVDGAPCGYFVFDDQGHVLDVNDTLLAWLAAERAQVVGAHIDLMLPPAGRVFHQTHFFPLLRLNGRADEMFIALRTRSGQDLPFLASAARRETPDGARNECVLLPMKERRRHEAEILAARRAADVANEAKSRFLSMMSHDLRTPLQTIVATTKALSHPRHGPLNDVQRSDLARIERASGELLRLLTDILEFSRAGSGRVQPNIEDVGVDTALDRAESLLRPQIDEAGLAYERHEQASLRVRADSDRLQQILLNLMTNAIKYTPRGGCISVAAAQVDREVLLHISDTGPGIPAGQLDTIFEPFVQLDAHGLQGGVGLGLAISRELARAMEGDIVAHSRPGDGSTFTLALRASAP